MSNRINNWVRPNILALQPYSSARHDFKGQADIYLDANENPFGGYNRYPDPYQSELKTVLASIKQVDKDQIFIGNGSDECIDLIYRAFCEPGQEKVVTFGPTYGMYKVSAGINNIEYVELPLSDTFDIEEKAIEPYLNDASTKVIWLCTPNNPTANCLSRKKILNIITSFNGLVVIDEAYIDFTKEKSFTSLINTYDNLIVLQTLSKAWSLANLRVGVAYSNPLILEILNKIKPPYNISGLVQLEAIKRLKNKTAFQEEVKIILRERNRVTKLLAGIEGVKKIYPSEANFLLIEVKDAYHMYNYLADLGVVIRNRHSAIANTLRITIGTKYENDQLIEKLKHYTT